MLSASTLYGIEWKDGWWIEKDLNASSHGLNRGLSWHLPGVIEENHRKPQVRTAGVPMKIRTKCIPSTNAEHYCYISLISTSGIISSLQLVVIQTCSRDHYRWWNLMFIICSKKMAILLVEAVILARRYEAEAGSLKKEGGFGSLVRLARHQCVSDDDMDSSERYKEMLAHLWTAFCLKHPKMLIPVSQCCCMTVPAHWSLLCIRKSSSWYCAFSITTLLWLWALQFLWYLLWKRRTGCRNVTWRI
jgi:hypothetical protein